MFTIEDIQTIVQRFYVKDDKVYARNIEQEIVDEQAVLPIKAAYLIFNEAEIRYKNDLQLLGLKYVSNREKYLEKMMERFSVNGEENDLGQNKLIRDLVASNGHYEETISSDGLDAKFSIFIEPKKSYGLAYFRLKLREVGLDTDDLSLSYDTSNLKNDGTAKLYIDFKPKIYVEKDEIDMEDSSFEYRFAYDELNKAIEKGKTDRIEYWSDFLKQWKKARLSRDIEQLKFLQGIVETIVKDIEKRRQNSNSSSKREPAVENLISNAKEEDEKPKNILEDKKVDLPNRQEETLKEQVSNVPEKADKGCENPKAECEMKQDIEVKKNDISISHVQSSEESKPLNVAPKTSDKSAEKVEITNSLLLRFDEILKDIEKSKMSKRNKDDLQNVHLEARNAIKLCNIDETTTFYRGLILEEKEFVAKLMMKASSLLDDKMRYNHWENIHEDILKTLGWPSQIEVIVTPQSALENLEKLLNSTKGRILDEKSDVEMRKYSKICKSSWKEYNSEEKLKCAELLKQATRALNDEINFNYWSGVLDTLSSKIGEN